MAKRFEDISERQREASDRWRALREGQVNSSCMIVLAFFELRALGSQMPLEALDDTLPAWIVEMVRDAIAAGREPDIRAAMLRRDVNAALMLVKGVADMEAVGHG